MDIASSTRWSPMSAQITRYGYDQLNPEHINLLSSHSCKVSASLPIPACDCVPGFSPSYANRVKTASLMYDHMGGTGESGHERDQRGKTSQCTQVSRKRKYTELPPIRVATQEKAEAEKMLVVKVSVVLSIRPFP
eukprot:1187095-Prorocentrum_minimum.AAC.2